MQRSIPFLWILVIILLILNLVLVYGLNQMRVAALLTLTKVETTLDRLANDELVFNVNVNQPVPVKAEIPINQTVNVPLNTVVPLDFPLSGNAQLDAPLKLDIPVNTVVPVELNETIKVDTVVYLNTTIPVRVRLSETSLAGYFVQARLLVTQFKSHLMLQGQVTQDFVFVDTPGNGTIVNIDPVHVDSALSPNASPPEGVAPLPASETVLTESTQTTIIIDEPPAQPPAVNQSSNPGPIVNESPAQSPETNSEPTAPPPQPTATNVPPVQPTVTNTPVVEPSPTNVEWIALLAYAKDVNNSGAKITEAGEAFGQSALAFQSGALTEDQFYNEFLLFVPEVRGPIQEINQISPPPAVAGVHQKLTGGLNQCNQAIDLMNEWFSTHSNGTKETAALLVVSCISQVQAVETELKVLVGQ